MVKRIYPYFLLCFRKAGVFDRSFVRERGWSLNRGSRTSLRLIWSTRKIGKIVRFGARSKRTYELTSSIVPRGTSFSVELEFSFLSRLILRGSHSAVASRVHWNSVPSTQMRCMITANRRASATIAFFIRRCLAIFIAQALSQDHFAKRTNMI